MDTARTALIIEDDLDTQLLYRHSLRSQNFEAKAVSSGNSALEHLKKNPAPDLILLDLSMPGMDGAEFMVKLRENSDWDAIRVIVVSGWDDLKTRAQEVGADGFLHKPFTRDLLRQEIEHCFDS